MRHCRIEWNKLTHTDFESLCCDVLIREGYKNVAWVGKQGADRSRDILADRIERITQNKELVRRCLVQCKRHLTDPPSVSDLSNTLGWADAHKPDLLLIMISNTLRAEARDWLEKMQSEKKYDIVAYEETDFENFFDRNDDLYTKYFGEKWMTPRKIAIDTLLDRGSMTAHDLADVTSFQKDEIMRVLDELQKMGLVSSNNSRDDPRYSLVLSMSAFEAIAGDFLDGERRFEFLKSLYARSITGSDLMNHLQARYHFEFSQENRDALIRLFSISPLALKIALFSPTERYNTAHLHGLKLELNEEQQKKLSQSMETSFISMLLQGTLTDLNDPGSKVTLAEHKVDGYHIGVEVKMANINETVLNAKADTTVMILKAKGPIKEGELVQPSDPSLFNHTGMVLLNLGEIEEAIRQFDTLISAAKDDKLLARAWNNKGVCYLRLEQRDKARPCFKRALELDPSLVETRKNLNLCTEP